MESSFEPQLESFFGPSIREFLLYAAATTDENEPEYDSTPETSTSCNEFSSFDSALPGPSLLEDKELDELMRACASCLDDFDTCTEPLEKRPRIAASNPAPVKRKFGPAKTGEDLATARI